MAATWTDARKARLKELWEAGKSASQIADEFGDVSRNAIIGRLHRSKMFDATRRSEPGVVHRRRASAPSQPRPRAAPKARKPESQTTAAIEAPVPVLPIVDAQIPVDQRRDLDRLDGRCCHWPVGDPRLPDFFFCGAVVNEGEAYCPAHMQRAHVPTVPLKYKNVKFYDRR